MILDESIELKNKKENIFEMEYKIMNEMSNQHMRSLMEAMALDEAMKGCMFEVLTMEGFLPETLDEGETYEESLSVMMEDDQVMSEMYKACSMNESDCGNKMESWINEKLTGGQSKLDMNKNGKIDSEDFEMLRNKNTNEGGDDYLTQEGKHPEGKHYKVKLNQICDDIKDTYEMINNNDELPAWIQDKIAVMYHSADAIKTYLSGEQSSMGLDGDSYKGEPVETQTLSSMGFKVEEGEDDIHFEIEDGFESEEEEFELEEEDGFLEEISLPIKGKNVDAENKTNSNKENSEVIKKVETSQETESEKVDNLKNQKYEKNDWEGNVDEILNGWRNNLDLDYNSGLSKDFKDKIKDQASGLAPKDHANVDHDSKGGEKLIKGAEKRSKDEFINGDDYTSRHDRTQIEKGQTYTKKTAFNNESEEKGDELINEELDRLKKLFSYEDKNISENKTKQLNEDDILFKQISTKKFI